MSLLLGALALCAGGPALADIYMFKDEKGVVHFTNIPNGDKRFRMVRKEESTSDYARAAGMPQYVMPTAELIRIYRPIIETAAKTHGVETALVHAVITAESGYNPRAVSRAGAQGHHAADAGHRAPLRRAEQLRCHGQHPWRREVPAASCSRCSTATRNSRSPRYNAGENAVIRAGRRIPPYAETVNYVPKVLGLYRKFQTSRL